MSSFDMMCLGTGLGFLAAVIINAVLRSDRPDPIADDFDWTVG